MDLPSGPGCSLKYLPCSHFNPHLNTSSILGHYSGSVCPARLSLRLVLCARVWMVVKVTQPGWIPLYPGVTLASESHSARRRLDLSRTYSRRRNHPNQLLFLSSSSSLFMIVPSVFYLYHSQAPHSNPTEREGCSFVSVNDTDASPSAYRLIPPLFSGVKGWG